GDKDLVANETPPPLEVKKKRKPKDDQPQETRKSRKQDDPTSTQPQETAAPEALRTQPVDKPLDPIKVSLPFADTPIIRRNKEMRKGAENGSRRSSLGMRGRRASSLIDSGKSDGKEVPMPYTCNMTDDIVALPHDDVDSSEFYKHIESSLTEPRRMKQLLTWCGTRALGEKPSSSQRDFQARQAAREIQQQLLKDFSTKSEMSDWFNRKDTTPPPQPPKPNPKNVSNENKIRDLEQQLARCGSKSPIPFVPEYLPTRQTPNRAPNLGKPSPPSFRIPFSLTLNRKSCAWVHFLGPPRVTESNLRTRNPPIRFVYKPRSFSIILVQAYQDDRQRPPNLHLATPPANHVHARILSR
ncbi:MAG: hypothetical protein Q9193_007245, partial [Seirophora villosa]